MSARGVRVAPRGQPRAGGEQAARGKNARSIAISARKTKKMNSRKVSKTNGTLKSLLFQQPASPEQRDCPLYWTALSHPLY